MCQFFSAIATKDGRLLFTEDDSHETIVERAGLSDAALYARSWIRLEAVPSKPIGPDSTWTVRVDEATTPGWYTDEQVNWEDRITSLANRIAPARTTRDAAVASAWATYVLSISSIEGYVSDV